MTTAARPLIAAALCLAPVGAPLAQNPEPIEENEAAEAAQAPADPAGAVRLSPVTVYATRGERQLLDVPANVTVIPQERIRRETINDLQELMRHEPGVVVNRQTSATDPFNTFGGFTIRGVGGNRTQILVDGSRVPERIIDGTRDFIDLRFTRSVEIVRGPGSVLWGSDALGGIVAFETLDPEDLIAPGESFGGQASLGYDSFNNGVDSSVVFGQAIAPWLSVLAGFGYDMADEGELSRARADGGLYGCPRNLASGATPCNALDPTDQRGRSFLGKIVLTPTPDHRFELSADLLDRQTDVEFNQVLGPVYSTTTGLPTGETNLDYDRTLDLSRQRFGLSHDWTVGAGWLDALSWSVAYAPQDYARTGDRLSTSAAGDTLQTLDSLSYAEDFLELDIQFDSRFRTFGATHAVTWGFDGDYTKTDYERIDVVRNLTTGTETVTRGGGFNFANADTIRADIYVQDEITYGPVTVTPGLRYATYSIDPRPDADYKPVAGKEPRKITDEALTGKLGAVVRLDETYSVYGSYARGFKMPTAQQLFTSLPGAFFNLIPAPDLRPETVDSYEVGLRGSYRQGWFSVNGFFADYKDFIQSFYNPPGTSDFTYRNLSSVEVWGIEATGEVRFDGNWRGSGSLSWQRGTQKVDPDSPSTPFDVAPLTATLGLGYDLPQQGLSFDVIGTFASKVTRTSSPTAFKPGGYAVFDAIGSWELTDGVALNAGIYNLFDKRYFQAPLAGVYETTVSASVARSNPIELQTAPGRTFRISLDIVF